MRSYDFKDTLIVTAGQALCVAAMTGIFALLGKFDMTVLWGALAGGVIATANFFLLTFFANKAADKAEAQDVAGGQKLIQLSYMGRMLGLFVALILCAKSGFFHPLPLVIPLALTRPILTVSEIFRKKGGTNP
jgi:hypothetical protein